MLFPLSIWPRIVRILTGSLFPLIIVYDLKDSMLYQSSQKYCNCNQLLSHGIDFISPKKYFLICFDYSWFLIFLFISLPMWVFLNFLLSWWYLNRSVLQNRKISLENREDHELIRTNEECILKSWYSLWERWNDFTKWF